MRTLTSVDTDVEIIGDTDHTVLLHKGLHWQSELTLLCCGKVQGQEALCQFLPCHRLLMQSCLEARQRGPEYPLLLVTPPQQTSSPALLSHVMLQRCPLCPRGRLMLILTRSRPVACVKILSQLVVLRASIGGARQALRDMMGFGKAWKMNVIPYALPAARG